MHIQIFLKNKALKNCEKLFLLKVWVSKDYAK